MNDNRGIEYISMSWDSGRNPVDNRHMARLTFNFMIDDHDAWLAVAKLGVVVDDFIKQKLKEGAK